MGFWDSIFGSPDTVESLTADVQGFLSTFAQLGEKCNAMKVGKEAETVVENNLHTANVESAYELYQLTVDSETTRHVEVVGELESDIEKLEQNISIASKITSFFED